MDFCKKLAIHDVEIDGSGDIEIGVQGGYYGEMELRTFDIAELEDILKQAKAHKEAYDVFKSNDYQDFPEIGTMVNVKVGRNKGESGKIVTIHNNKMMVDFDKIYTLPDGFQAQDRYWVRMNEIEEIK